MSVNDNDRMPFFEGGVGDEEEDDDREEDSGREDEEELEDKWN